MQLVLAGPAWSADLLDALQPTLQTINLRPSTLSLSHDGMDHYFSWEHGDPPAALRYTGYDEL